MVDMHVSGCSKNESRSVAMVFCAEHMYFPEDLLHPASSNYRKLLAFSCLSVSSL